MTTPQQDEDASILKLGEEFEKAKCLMNAEVLQLLQQKKDRTQEEEPEAGLNQVYEKSLAYVERFGRYQNPEAVKQLRELLANKHKLKEFEVCVIGNLNPETVDEVKSIVPSLTMVDRNPPIDDDQIEAMLADLATIKKFE